MATAAAIWKMAFSFQENNLLMPWNTSCYYMAFDGQSMRILVAAKKQCYF